MQTMTAEIYCPFKVPIRLQTDRETSGFIFTDMPDWYYTITEWMLNLDIQGTEINLFAIIYGYSQKGDGCCYATRSELARRCFVKSTRTIDNAMNTLIEKGLVRKFTIQRDGSFLTAYSITAKIAQGAQKLHTPAQELHTDTPQLLQGGCAKIAHMENKRESKNIDNIILPFASKEFRETWEILTQQPKWKKKSRQALEMSLKKLAAHTEAEAIEMMQNSIANDWQGVFEPDRKRTQQPRTKQDEFRYKVNDIWGMK